MFHSEPLPNHGDKRVRILGPAGEGVRGRDQKGGLGRRGTVADKRGRVPQTLVMWTLGLGSADGAKVEKWVRSREGFDLSSQPPPSVRQGNTHTYILQTSEFAPPKPLAPCTLPLLI